MTEENTTEESTIFEEKSELELLKERADLIGIKYHPNIGLEKLKEKVNAALAPKAEKTPKTATQVRMENIKKANKLERIRVVCMDPNRKGWKGDYFTFMNSEVGTIKKFVPFNTIWHAPQVIVKMLKRKKRQEFYEVKAKHGMKVKRARQVPMFAVEELPDLTKDELEELARQQSHNRSIDE